MSLTPAISVRRLMLAAIAAGAIAGGALFLLQYATMSSLIQRAEAYERASASGDHDDHATREEWQPADGAERTTYTAVTTVLTGIAFAAITLGAAHASGVTLDARRGLVLGLAGFVCFVLAPSAGLPPTPPGVSGAEVDAAQIWWVMTVGLTAVALWLIFRPGANRMTRALGLFALLLPHVIGAPPRIAPDAPIDFASQFAWISVATRLPFWLLLGGVGGHLLRARPLASSASNV